MWIIEVLLARGDLLVFDSRLPHGTVRNDSAAPRAAFYVQLHPQGDPAQRAQCLDDLKAGRCPPWWRWKPGHDRLDPHEIDLNPLGRRLAGLDVWESESS